MSFLFKLGAIFTIFLLIIIYDYQSYDLETRQKELKFMKEYTLVPSYIFKSNEYKEFIYAK